MKTIMQGAVMGVAELIPGISGSTLALTMGIYDEFVNLLHAVSVLAKSLLLLPVKKSSGKQVSLALKAINLRFAALLLIGMFLAIGLFSGLLSNLLETHPDQVFAVFTGIIISSLYIPFKALKGIRIEEVTMIIVSFILMFSAFGLTPNELENPPLLLVYFGGVVGITGLFLPGVSGSFILLVLGLYHYVIDIVKSSFALSVSSDQLVSLFVFAAGLLTGFMVSVKLLRYLLANQYRYLMAFVAGLMLASLRVLWPFAGPGGQNIPPWEVGITQLVPLVLLIIFAAGITFYIAARSENTDSLSK